MNDKKQESDSDSHNQNHTDAAMPDKEHIEQTLARARKQNRRAFGKALLVTGVITLVYLFFRYR